MDKYEMTIRTEQLKKQVRVGDYVSAAKIADGIEWKKIKQLALMNDAVTAYTAVGNYEAARNVLVYAYNRNFRTKGVLSSLVETYIKTGEFDEAEDVYNEYAETYPKNLDKLILYYHLRRAKGAPIGELIDIMQEYKDREFDEEQAYELASLYEDAGLPERCVKECDELILWFAEGEYVMKALLLKKRHAPLTPKQELLLARLERMQEMEENASQQELEYSEEEYEEEEDTEAIEETMETAESASDEFDYEDASMETNTAKASMDEDDMSEDFPEDDQKIFKNNSLRELARGRKNKKHAPARKLKDDLFNTTSWEPFDLNQCLNGNTDYLPVVDDNMLNETEAEPEAEEVITEAEPVLQTPESVVDQAVKEEPEEPEKAENSEMVEVPETVETPEEVKIPEKVTSPEEVQASEEPLSASVDSQDEWEEWEECDDESDIQSELEVEAAEETSDAAATENVTTSDSVDDIKIIVPDYSVYDTRNLQMELAANMKLILEAGEERDRKDAVEAQNEIEKQRHAEPEIKPVSENNPNSSSLDSGIDKKRVYVTIDTETPDEPTKEIIINKRQWRKADRNRKRNEVSQNTQVFTAIGLQEKLAVETVKETPIADNLENKKDEAQIEGQKDIIKWLDSIQGEETAVTVENPVEVSPAVEETAAANVEKSAEVSSPVEETATTNVEDISEKEEAIENELSGNEDDFSDDEDNFTDYEDDSSDDEVDEDDFTDDENRSSDDELADGENDEEEYGEDDEYDEDEYSSEDYQVTGEHPVITNPKEYELSDNEKLFLEKYFSIPNMENKLNRFVAKRHLMEHDGTSFRENFIVSGSDNSDNIEFAISLIKAIYTYDEKRAKRIAKTSAEGLNSNGIEVYRDRIEGGVLMVMDAEKLNEIGINALYKFMQTNTGELLVILIGNNFFINKMLGRHRDFAECFGGVFELRHYNVSELVDIAKTYAKDNNYVIDDKALIALYDAMANYVNLPNAEASNKVYEIMDNAAENAAKHFGNRTLGKLRSKITIKLKDFEF